MQPKVMSDLSYHQPGQLSQQHHALSYPQPTEAKAEELPAEEYAGLRPVQNPVEQIFNSGVIIERHLQYQRDVFHNFKDFKKAFDRVWQQGLWQILRSFNIEEDLVQAVQSS